MLLDIFSDNVDILTENCCTVEKCNSLLEQVKDEIKNTVVLYTKNIEEKYFEFSDRTVHKRIKNDPLDYALAFINHKNYYQLNPLTKMWLFVALDIPRATTTLSKSQFISFVDELFLHVDKCKITHGDAVGIIAAQSCSERFTQSTLNSFHSAGAKKSALVGLTRINEILDAYKKLNLPVLGPIDTKYDITKLYYKTMDDYCSDSGIVYKPELNPGTKSNYFLFFKLLDPADRHEILSSSYLNSKSKDSMFYKDGTIYFYLHKNTTLDMPDILTNASSPHNAYAIYAKEANRHVSGLVNCVDFDEEDRLLFFNPKSSLASCLKSPLDDEPDRFKTNIDLNELLRICPDVDLLNIVSNDIYWIYTTLGIAAVETYLTKEINSVLGAEGININIQHINLITANMTQTGAIRANKYSGLKGMGGGVIRKATFQQGTETFSKAAAAHAVDHISDVSSQIMLGKRAGVGTSLATSLVPISTQEKEEEEEYGCPSPLYAPLSPEFPDYQPSSPVGNTIRSPEYQPSSPLQMIEPEIHI